MAYEKPITIKQAIAAIADDEYVLPSIQREFVWGTDQIEILFDSLMRDYPISTFLFWKVKAENIGRFKFYRFLKTYHERDERHNQEASLSGERDVVAILDGQQRLTSIYVGLLGTHATKLRNHWASSNHAYPKKKLYLNLLKESDDITREYDFQFLADADAKVRDAEAYWVPAGKVLEFKSYEDASDWVNDVIEDFSATLDAPLTSEVRKAARRRLCTLFRVVCERDTLNFYLETSEELDKVLQIFIRINQGGTQLSYSDLLLSIATAQWKTLNAREEIYGFVDRINDIGSGFNFSKDFILKSCLVLADLKDIKFKVDNFSSDNMAIIESQWDSITKSISLAIRLAAHFGFDSKTLTSANAIIPLAYFIKDRGLGEELLQSKSQEENRIRMKQWLIRALLRRHFGGTPDNLYPIYRQVIQGDTGNFPLTELIARFSGTNKPLDFHSEDIENLMGVNYGTTFAFMLLSLLYPLIGNYSFHQDHIHPKKMFTRKRLADAGITDTDTQDAYLTRFNLLPNLQLLQATPNQEKSDKPLAEWFVSTMPDQLQQQQYRELHRFPAGQALKLTDFLEFYEGRAKLIRAELGKILNVTKPAPIPVPATP